MSNQKAITEMKLTIRASALLLACGLATLTFGQGAAKKAPAKPAAAPASTAPSGPVAIKGGKVLTITKGVIENGVVVMENGKITAVGGPGTAIPRGARVIEAAGMTVYPGFIDSETNLGLIEVEADPMTNDLVETSDEIMPHMHVVDAFHAETVRIPVVRINGVTNAIVAPGSGDTLPGQDAFIQLDGKDRDEIILVPDIAMPLNFTAAQRRTGGRGGEGGGSRYPSTREGMAAQLRQTFLDALDYEKSRQSAASGGASAQEKEDSSAQGGRGGRRGGGGGANKRDLRYEALLPYLHGQKPVIVTAQDSSDMETAMGLAREFNLKVILKGLTHSQEILDKVASWHVPVILGSIYSAPRNGERYDTVFSLPAELVKRGVKIAFASYRVEHNRNLPYAAGYAVAYGLPYEEALKAITINPAEIWGVEKDLGSLEVGKTANVVIANGDPLDVRTDVKQVFIHGREIPMQSRQTLLRDEYGGTGKKQ
jgi:imidazolonepropionase-like amidohydrolase